MTIAAQAPGRTAMPVRTVSPRSVSGEQGAQPDLASQAGAQRRDRPAEPASDQIGLVRDRPDGRRADHRSRTSFVLLLLGLLGASLGCLLVVNTTLAANSITINDLQQANQAGMQQVQEMRQQVAAAGSAAEIAKEARRLHMRSDGLRIVDLHTGEIIVPGAGAAPSSGKTAGSGQAPDTEAVPQTGERRAGGLRVSGRSRR